MAILKILSRAFPWLARGVQVDTVPADDVWFCLGSQMVKLVRLSNVRDIVEAQKRAGEMGCLLVGERMLSLFIAMFPTYDGRGPIIFGGIRAYDPVFGSLFRDMDVSFIDEVKGVSAWNRFRLWPNSPFFGDNCRWLVFAMSQGVPQGIKGGQG